MERLEFAEEEECERELEELVVILEEDIGNFSSDESMIERTGRKSAEDGKDFAFNTPVMEALGYVYQPCNQTCNLSGECTKPISGKSIIELRNHFFHAEGIEAPKDKERGKLILDYIKKARQDHEGNLIFTVDDHEVCTPAFLRLLGVSSSVDMAKAPGQWNRLIKNLAKKDNKDTLLSEEDLKADSSKEFTAKKGHVKSFINDVARYFSDSLPVVTTEDGNTHTMQVPYGTIQSFYDEYTFHCKAKGIGRDVYASYATFARAFNELHDAGAVMLLGGKSGFQTCALCNNVIAIKRSACCKRDEITRDALLKLNRLHLLQQSTERQHAENVIEMARVIKGDQPVLFYADIDGQSTWTGNTPKFAKDRTSKTDTCIENRNIGARIVCGAIDDYISISTNNLIPGGANVLVEVTRFCIQWCAKKLQEFKMIMPKKMAFQFDNSGENKVSKRFF